MCITLEAQRIAAAAAHAEAAQQAAEEEARRRAEEKVATEAAAAAEAARMRAQQEEAIALRTRSGRSSPKNTTAVGGEVAGGEVSEAKRTLDQAWLALNAACDAAKKAEVVCAMAASLLATRAATDRYLSFILTH